MKIKYNESDVPPITPKKGETIEIDGTDLNILNIKHKYQTSNSCIINTIIIELGKLQNETLDGKSVLLDDFFSDF